MIIGTAGHIDHGKSALVKALTGIDPDRLKEEQLRGITIDLGFAHLSLDGGVAGIVDVPGHERLIHNMLAGAGGMDLALVVVAADEGVKPQTLEHIEILDLLGIRDAIGVITKIDLVGDDERAVARLELEELLETTAMAHAPIVEVSALTEEGLPELRALLNERAGKLDRKPLDRPFRLPLDRVFTIQGFGTVVTGTAVSGRVSLGQNLDIVPTGEEVRVRSIEVHGTRRDEACAGERVAMNIAGRRLQCRRGFVLAERGIFAGTDCMDCRLRVLRPAPKGRRSLVVRLHLHASEVMARVVPLEDGVLVQEGEGYVQIRTREPIPAVRGDRFVLRSEDDSFTMGGGDVIDAFAPRHGPKRGLTARTLRGIDRVEDSQAFDAFLDQRSGGATPHEIARVLNLPMAGVSHLATERCHAGTAVLATDGARYVSRGILDHMASSVTGIVSHFHGENPMRPAMALADLRSRFESRVFPVLDTALQELSARQVIVVEAGTVRSRDHIASFDSEREGTRLRVLAAYQQAGLQPPDRKTLIAELARCGLPDPSGVIESLIQTGDILALTHELLMHRSVLDDAKGRLLPQLQSPEGVTVAQAREILGTTRKYAVPLFELLDRQGFTVRRGDVRILSPARGVVRQDQS
ncbi:selenocysteine-specific translation elongation factor [Candidatus Fermentibacteria bacterium]|nr:selenocysteine-specific translation elongation factor [Candidatus Fermentibacteria bacterium]